MIDGNSLSQMRHARAIVLVGGTDDTIWRVRFKDRGQRCRVARSDFVYHISGSNEVDSWTFITGLLHTGPSVPSGFQTKCNATLGYSHILK